MKWPRCGFRYVTSPQGARDGAWYRCERRWGHWLLPRGMPHIGPREGL
jgi:hypothetical protein